VCLLQDEAGPHLRLTQDLVPALARVLGDFPAVLLGVRHVPVRCFLGLRQYVHGLYVPVFGLHSTAVAFEHSLAQPEDLLL
jgi:hypothetical protein